MLNIHESAIALLRTQGSRVCLYVRIVQERVYDWLVYTPSSVSRLKIMLTAVILFLQVLIVSTNHQIISWRWMILLPRAERAEYQVEFLLLSTCLLHSYSPPESAKRSFELFTTEALNPNVVASDDSVGKMKFCPFCGLHFQNCEPFHICKVQNRFVYWMALSSAQIPKMLILYFITLCFQCEESSSQSRISAAISIQTNWSCHFLENGPHVLGAQKWSSPRSSKVCILSNICLHDLGTALQLLI